jgi:hypothetical protein
VRPGRVAILSLLLASVRCDCGDPAPPDDTFDGNVIIGDGGAGDAAPGADAMGDGSAGDASDGDGSAGDGLAGDTAEADAADPCAEAPIATLSATAAVAEIGTYDGRVVAVEGRLEPGPLSCTEIACPQDMPCCNTCTASVTVAGLVRLAESPCSPPPGCRGSECGQVCSPAVLPTPRRCVGRLSNGAAGVELILFSVE